MSIKDLQYQISSLCRRCLVFFTGQQQTHEEFAPPINTERIWSLNGKTAIYAERRRILHVTISDVREYQNGFLATATPIKTHGLFFRDSPFNFGTAWKYLSLRSDRIATYGYVSWELFTEPEIIEGAIAIVAGLPSGKTYMDDCTTEPIDGGTILKLKRFLARLPNAFLTFCNFDW